MRSVRAGGLTLLFATAVLAACQTPTLPPEAAAETSAAPAVAEQPTRVVGERENWVIEFHAADPEGRPFCKAWRPNVRGARLVFVSAAEESAFRLSGVGPRKAADDVRLQARFDDGERTAYRAAVQPGPSLVVTFPTARYDDAVHRFARNTHVAFRGPGGPLANFDLNGTLWALNALDECRRVHTGT